MSDFTVNLYDAIRAQARYVALWWNEVPIPPGHEIKLSTILQGLPSEPGLYAITGRHDAYAGGGVLYIGQAEHVDGKVRGLTIHGPARGDSAESEM